MSSIRFLAAAALAASLVVPAAAFAQQTPAPAPMPPGQVMRHHGHHHGFRSALGKLNLSAAQKSQIDQIFAQSKGMNKGADPATRKANRQKQRADIEAILTPQQRAQLKDALKQARRNEPPRT